MRLLWLPEQDVRGLSLGSVLGYCMLGDILLIR